MVATANHPTMPAERLVGAPGRLDVVLTRLTGLTRADVQRAIASGLVTVDGVHRGKSYVLEGGEVLEARVEAEAPLQPEAPPVAVRFEDAHLLVIAKPAGLVTHPTERRRSGTVVNRLLGMGVRLPTAGGPLRPGIVHRLDAGTSGLMVVAKTGEAYGTLLDMFRRHDVVRRYLALVRGRVEHDTFAVDAPLGRHAARVVLDTTGGRPATTRFEVRERPDSVTLLVALPETGRTHQIRVHLSSIGHPILGDRAYGGAGDDARRLRLTRPFLHSWRIAFRHPVTGAQVELEEPLPDDLAAALERARSAGDP
jgi:23S rRNA pseudouridine1911/1915/1917 synthase